MDKTYLSANTLFHFTNNIDNIINILTNEFSPRYCMESFEFLGGCDLEIAIPMVCFCDIPLSQIKNHIENYGGYAIGLSKEWGGSKGINPVAYSIKNSLSTKAISNVINIINRECEDEQKKNDIDNAYDFMCNFVFYMKPYEGNSWNKEKFDGKYTRFYDEREWRYIPDIDVIKKYNIDWFLEKEEFLDYKGRREYNNKISEIIKLSFEPDDIKYIIVNSEDEILDLFRAIDNIKGDKYSLNRINILKTRIISKDQILNDF
ncbi:TPA: abortive infection system antitoxin AbiGi family protein [Clostridium perfringens]|uniref:abortive infection system antitoxin AbiGi family protein n=1 Tax=Clostridium perfringens TaxID=1502 RepID=UPI001CCED764|nr:abortive infection system antitoxin AbiGi family protein [Clostridium perfringens]MDU2781746.1 abortive infection system antitoxin AbiGi family protein [Clostridium perfringens]MDU4023899.1 abortive infection system antitoxin AbiGi family protein [Clostridium perfringens]UBK31997.1 hypothetical protein KLF45_00960 [Clostridium perfringens]